MFVEPFALLQISQYPAALMASPPLLSPDQWRLAVAVLAGLFGLMIGSFLNVCIYRVPAGLSIVTPRSYCYSCGTTISGFHNIPILSYLLLGGCCQSCGAPFSSRYMWIELLTGVLFGWIAWMFCGTHPLTAGPNGAMLVYTVFAGYLIVATFTDLDHFIIPDGVSVGSGVAAILMTTAAGAAAYYGVGGQYFSGLIAPIAFGWPLDPSMQVGPRWAPVLALLCSGTPWGIAANSVLGALCGYLGLYGVRVVGTALFRKEAMGMGDVKLMLGIGAILGPVLSLAAFFIACCLGAVFALFGVVWEKFVLRMEAEGPLREVYAGAGGPLAEARVAELALLERSNNAGTSETAEESASAPEETPITVEPSGDSDAPSARALRAAEQWSLAGLGRLLARESRKPRPYQYRHLPFGPSLAVAALLALIFHARLVPWIEANFISGPGFREIYPKTVRWERTLGPRPASAPGHQPRPQVNVTSFTPRNPRPTSTPAPSAPHP
jgi:leader peptidase (prepilin peptidase)/N-methyltransferase